MTLLKGPRLHRGPGLRRANVGSQGVEIARLDHSEHVTIRVDVSHAFSDPTFETARLRFFAASVRKLSPVSSRMIE